MTHKARILKMLEEAGPRGIRSDVFYREFMGRGAARIRDLKSDGYEISSEREGKFCRYRLQEQCGVTSRSIKSAQGAEANPATAWIDPGTRQALEPGDESEVPAAAPEVVGVGVNAPPSGKGSSGVAGSPRPGPDTAGMPGIGVDSGERRSEVELPGSSYPSPRPASPEPSRLFALPPESALTRRPEAA